MGNISTTITRVLENAVKAFRRFPASIINAIGFTIVAMIKNSMDYNQIGPYNFMLNSIQLAFAFGAIFSLAAITYSQSRHNTKSSFLTANILGMVAAAIAFFYLYFFGRLSSEKLAYETSFPFFLSRIASSRIFAAILISIIGFIVASSTKSDSELDEANIAGSLFMTLKAFFLALIYGLVLGIGTSGIVFAIRSLLYRDLSIKVFGYVLDLVVFVAFCIFVGYFPDFRKGSDDEHRETAQKQPKFIAMLFEFVLVPIMLVLTVVLVLWAVRTITGGMDIQFNNLYIVSTSFAVGGLLLHILITHAESKTAVFYKKVFPFAVIFILIFEAWALITQLQKFGLKTSEYMFIVIWIVAMVSAILLIIRGNRAHILIALVTSVMAVVTVLPIIGFVDLPGSQQTKRLENLLTSQGMIQGNKIVHATTEPSNKVKQDIYDAVSFLLYSEYKKTPEWFVRKDLNYERYSDTMGFNIQYYTNNEVPQENPLYSMLVSNNEVEDISDYQWVISGVRMGMGQYGNSEFKGNKGSYTINWNPGTKGGTFPILEIKRDGVVVLTEDFSGYTKTILEKYPLGTGKETPVDQKDMTYTIENGELKVLMIFDYIEMSKIKEGGEMNYGVSTRGIYIKEK